MKITRLSLLLLALIGTAFAASAKEPGHFGKPPKGGSGLQTKAAGWWYYCYSDPGTVYDCDLGSSECQQECADRCKGYCDWDASAS
jgi:hypothetical protein